MQVVVFAACRLLVSSTVSAQQKMYNGRVTDQQTQKPLPGASITVQGKNTGTTASADGYFSISASPGDDLLVESVGYSSQTIRLDQQSGLNIRLQSTAFAMEDVVVVGYGTRKKKDFTGAVGTLKLENTAFANSAQC